LCRSHILPEFLYRPLYDEKHRYSVVRVGEKTTQLAQRGLTEKLLCSTCEQRFSRHEKYAAEVMTGRLGHRYKNSGRRIVIDGLDYEKFKLFQMSILWRASVSSLDFFRLVRLGPHQETLREMLSSDDPGMPDRFGCVVIFATENGQHSSDNFFNPEPLRCFGRRMMKFYFAGAAWLFHCDARPACRYLHELFLNESGTLNGLFSDFAESKLLSAEERRIARRIFS
jgi:hypothetical protein